jgi:hypothetical protein
MPWRQSPSTMMALVEELPMTPLKSIASVIWALMAAIAAPQAIPDPS